MQLQMLQRRLDDAGRAHVEKKGKQRVQKPVIPKSRVPQPSSCRSNTKRSHNAKQSNHEFDMSLAKRHKGGGSKGEKRRAVEASPSPSHAKKSGTNEPPRPFTTKTSHSEPITDEPSIEAQCITDIPSSLVASMNDKLSDRNLQLALDLLGGSGEQDACQHYLACSVRVHLDKTALGDSLRRGNLVILVVIAGLKDCEGETQAVVDGAHRGQFGMHHTLVVGFRFTTIPFNTTIYCIYFLLI